MANLIGPKLCPACDRPHVLIVEGPDGKIGDLISYTCPEKRVRTSVQVSPYEWAKIVQVRPTAAIIAEIGE